MAGTPAALPEPATVSAVEVVELDGPVERGAVAESCPYGLPARESVGDALATLRWIGSPDWIGGSVGGRAASSGRTFAHVGRGLGAERDEPAAARRARAPGGDPFGAPCALDVGSCADWSGRWSAILVQRTKGRDLAGARRRLRTRHVTVDCTTGAGQRGLEVYIGVAASTWHRNPSWSHLRAISAIISIAHARFFAS